jgi:L-arabinokinase
VLCYVSGHGYGHLTRTIALINALIDADPDVSVSVRTAAPRWLLETCVPRPVGYTEVAVDAGVLERGPHHQDAEGTLDAYARILDQREAIIEREVAWCAGQGIDVIVSDIPPLASVIGEAAGIPVVAVGNFSWDYIYRPWEQANPRHAGLVERIREAYGKTTQLLRLPLAHEMDAFPRQRDIPFIARERTWPAGEGRARLGIADDETRPLVLVAMRMGETLSRAANRLAAAGEVLVATFDPAGLDPLPNIIALPTSLQLDFPDVLATADVLISKLGYSMCAETVAGRTPVLYAPRYDYREHDVLAAGIGAFVPALPMPENDAAGDSWPGLVRDLLAAPMPPAPPVDGAAVAARAVLDI